MMKPTFDLVSPQILAPHPRNMCIYGDEDVKSLAEQISNSGWVRPLVVTPNGTIISGHRRWKAVCQLGWEAVPVEYREFTGETAQLEALLLENAAREKTVEQKVREGFAWEEIEKQKAKERQRQAAKKTNENKKTKEKQGKETGETGETLVQNFAQASGGKTRDAIAKKVELGSGYTYSKAAAVVKLIDTETESGKQAAAYALRRVLNQESINAAYQLVKQPSSQRDCILGLIISGKASNTKEAQQIYHQQESEACDKLSAYAQLQQPVWRSCWNCQHRGEMIDNQQIYCYKKGKLNLTKKGADARGEECKMWMQHTSDYDNSEYLTQSKTFRLDLPYTLKSIIEAAAAVEETTSAALVTQLICNALHIDLENFAKD